MPLYLVSVHPKHRACTVPVDASPYEYEVEGTDLAEACRRVIGMPVRTGTGVTRRQDRTPYDRRYIEPDRSRYDAVAHVLEKDEASIARGVAKAMEEVTARGARAAAIGRDEAVTRQSGTIHECVTLVDTWDDRDADHAALFRHWVENDWYDESGKDESWFHDLHERLAKAGVDGPAERVRAEAAYWEGVREVVAEAEAEREAAPAP